MKVFAVSSLTAQHGVSGGMERYFELILQGLAELGHSIKVLTTQLPFVESRDGICFHPLPVPRGARGRDWDFALFDFVRSHSERPDVVLSNSFVSHSLTRLSYPIVTIVQGSGLVDLISSLRMLAAGRGSVLLCLKEVGYALRESHRDQRRLMQGSARVISVSEQTRNSLHRLYGISSSKIDVLPAPVDTALFHPSSLAAPHIARSGNNPFRIISAGTLSRQKGFDVLLDAVAILAKRKPDLFRLTVAGRGPEMERLQRRSRHLGIDPLVDFRGGLGPTDVAEIFRQSDAFVLSTFREEGFPLVIAEALASGLPVIATRVGGNPTAVRDGIDGYLVKAGSSAELAARIETLAEQPELRLQMAAAGRARAVAELDKKVVSRRAEEILKSAVASA
ncbi:MAG TPA: glycosyltransferase family 4 protein [Acidobacteriota bacterium]|jgi:glycosyltransferase involved in cell wall biosynthesis